MGTEDLIGESISEKIAAKDPEESAAKEDSPQGEAPWRTHSVLADPVHWEDAVSVDLKMRPANS